LHIGRGIGRADDDHANIFPIGRNDQAAGWRRAAGAG
jgi:hypothetical protein